MSEREKKLEAALWEITSFANDYRRACIPAYVFLGRVLEITAGKLPSALATPSTSEWNEAITEVIAQIASGKGDDQALLRQRIRALKRKEQP